MLCGTTYFSPSLPMFAFVLDAGNVASLFVALGGRAGRQGERVCIAGRGGAGRGGAALGKTGRGGAGQGGAGRRWAKRCGLVKCVGDNCSAHRSHRLTVHRYDIVATSSGIRFNALVSVISLAACFACCVERDISPPPCQCLLLYSMRGT